MNEWMGEPPLLQRLTLRNILSYGSDAQPIDLRSLNVLIGPNGSGKSNLMEAISLLRAAPADLREVTRLGGGVQEWIWKGLPGATATIDAIISNPNASLPLRHVLGFREVHQTFHLEDEWIENERSYANSAAPYYYYQYRQGRPIIGPAGEERLLRLETMEPDLSILAQRRDPDAYPALSYLADVYQKVRIYREWTFGRQTIFRVPQKADMRNDRLEEDFSNLGLFLNRLRRTPQAKRAILEALGDLYEGFSDFDVSIEGGAVQVFFTEGDFSIPATRLSDGTLRFLCLAAILCDPQPPALICLEEPELGLHPDILPKVADLLISASQRTQLIVTTHSDILVDALTDMPEAVLICEKHQGQTEVRRLDEARLAGWLEKYRLGQLWVRGELGGTRW